MKNSFTELPDNELCPCGSGKTYKNCCKKKSFKFAYQNGKLIKQVKIAKELNPILKKSENLFREMYGREISDHDFVFPFEGFSTEEMAIGDVYTFREIGIPENKIYAYYKSGGLIPCDLNFDLLPEIELKEFTDLCKEYDEAMARPLDDGNMSALQLVAFANDYLKNIYYDANNKIKMTLNDYIRRHSGHVSLYDYEIKTINDYCIFLALKTLKTLTAIKKLYEEHLADSIYALSRGIFESYMYINAINYDESFFKSKIAPKVDSVNFTFDVKDGKTNYKCVIHNVSREPWNVDVKIFALTKYFTNKYDTDLYRLFYEPACRYVHTDVLSAQSYFNTFDPYDEIDPVLIAGVTAISVTAILVEQIGISEGTQNQYKKDVGYLLGEIKKDLITCFEIAASDPEHKNAVYQTLIERLQLEG